MTDLSSRPRSAHARASELERLSSSVKVSSPISSTSPRLFGCRPAAIRIAPATMPQRRMFSSALTDPAGSPIGARPARYRTPSSLAVVGRRRACSIAPPRLRFSTFGIFPRMPDSDPLKMNRKPILGAGERTPVQRHLIASRNAPAVAEQELVHCGLDLHGPEIEPDAFVHAVAERCPGVAVHLVLAALFAEPFRIELAWIGPVLVQHVRAVQVARDIGIGRDVDAEQRRV